MSASQVPGNVSGPPGTHSLTIASTLKWGALSNLLYFYHWWLGCLRPQRAKMPTLVDRLAWAQEASSEPWLEGKTHVQRVSLKGEIRTVASTPCPLPAGSMLQTQIFRQDSQGAVLQPHSWVRSHSCRTEHHQQERHVLKCAAENSWISHSQALILE
jgi:hypothetical protein